MNDHYERLNDYLDGVLSVEEARAMETELERDPALRAEEQALRALIDEAARLPKGVAPQRDLWAGIDARMADRAPRSRRRMLWITQGLLAIAAAAVIFVADMWYARMTPTTPEQPGNSIAHVQVPTTQSNSVDAQQSTIEFAGYQEITAEYAGVRASLREALDRARPDLAPETVAVIDDSLVVIDQAIRDIQVALENDPGNRTLMQSLVAVYDQEVGLLRQATRLAERPGDNA